MPNEHPNGTIQMKNTQQQNAGRNATTGAQRDKQRAQTERKRQQKRKRRTRTGTNKSKGRRNINKQQIKQSDANGDEDRERRNVTERKTNGRNNTKQNDDDEL